MTVTPSSPTVGLFKDRSMAERAIDALHTAGFTSEQVRYSTPGTSGSILADLKSLFTGQNTTSGNITNDLIDMGLSNEEAQYYAHEFTNGNTILAVLAANREEEVLNIMHQYGAYNARTSTSSPTATYSQQPSDLAQQSATTPDDASLQPQASWQPQQQQSNVDEHVDAPYSELTSQGNSSDNVSTTQQPEYQPTQPLAPGYHSTPQVTLSPDQATPADSMESAATSNDQATPADSLEPAATSDDQATPTDSLEPAATSNDQVTPADSVEPATSDVQANHLEQTTPSDTGVSDSTSVATPSDTEAVDSTPELQDTQADTASYNSTSVVTPSNTEASASTPELQDTSSTTTTSEPIDEFQQLQEQLQAAQQQLQDARAQLQAAKEHEAQVQTIREREQKLQAARQQLQDIQAQLQATLAELHETKGRISQY